MTLPVCHAEEQFAYDEPGSGMTVDDGGWRAEGAGMGIYRLNLVKLGCWMNINAPLAVSKDLHPYAMLPTRFRR